VTKPSKLYLLLLQSSNRSITYRDFAALVEAFGFAHSRTKGSHRSYLHPNCPKLLIIQPNGNEAKRYQVREFLDLVRDFGLQMGS
jgi:predicted RNA binding protein YcfA (HicA-like mRNA interferase family)